MACFYLTNNYQKCKRNQHPKFQSLNTVQMLKSRKQMFTFKNVSFRRANSSSKFNEPDSSMPIYSYQLKQIHFEQKKLILVTFKTKL